eukprot:scaffold105246_cov43-Phaeocystis_antarctica.AAC.2
MTSPGHSAADLLPDHYPATRSRYYSAGAAAGTEINSQQPGDNQVTRRLALESADDAADGVGVGGGAAVGLRAQRRERHPLEPLGAPGVVE